MTAPLASAADPAGAATDRGAGRTPPGAPPPTDDQPWSWHANRAAALLLVVLVPLHFAVTFLVDDLGRTTARSLSERLDDPTWRILTWLVIALALVHATLSTDAALRVRRPGTLGVVLTAGVGLLAGGLLAAATWVLATSWV